MKKGFGFVSAFIAVVLVAILSMNVSSAVSAADAKTGAGLSEHVLKAYKEGWKYRAGGYGQFSGGVRGTDCSGLIKSYLWWTGDSSDPRPSLVSVAGSSGGMLDSASSKGKINYSDSSSLPRIHGLILYQPGHVGVYVGNNMAVDNRATGVNIKYEQVFGRNTPKWTMWFKLPQITYPTTGFVTFNGQKYYYENGQYVVSTTRTISGVTYTFGASGAMTASSAAAVQSAAGTANGNTGSFITLQADSKGADVEKLQQRLKDLGYYYESVNNYYDSCVSDAVCGFQSAAGLTSTGIADQATQAKLFASGAVKNPEPGTITPGMHSSLVLSLQKRLIALGYMIGDPTIYYGELTKKAVLAYQKAAGLAQTGVLDQAALTVLYSDTAVKAPAPSASSVAEKNLSSSVTEESKSQTVVFRNMLPAVNAAAAEKNTAETAAQNGDTAFSVVLLSVFLSGVFMTGKRILSMRKKMAVAIVKK
ncbi:C40 family peptidase [Caproiciproducens faecalis]|uniref:Peptidoglycan-binding protein n=1 Tax=Caproiciproducens faecalis TaxID=2820301 RepID=A0ABS7DR39_9FIRM|nr:peptidoglycan-binding protein [Caproiciproducens faecalis]MBW7573599.1 peptidoglycan-binding protein [Caproiciproducens faecalis]